MKKPIVLLTSLLVTLSSCSDEDIDLSFRNVTDPRGVLIEKVPLWRVQLADPPSNTTAWFYSNYI